MAPGMHGSDTRLLRNRLATTALGFAFATGLFMSGCASDPVSQKKINDRNVRMSHTIEGMKRSEERHPEKLERTMSDISRDEAQKKEQYRETMRTLGDRFW